ncbi:MAG: hypothetical protein M3340_13735 [Actinomycetota bacterium]|nr:hypothetical protein [Actinomycetota bacterium]
MTRRVTAVGLAMVLAAMLAPAPAGAATLTESAARKLATKLARATARGRDAQSWYLSQAVKVRRNRVVFVYNERSRDEVFCRARLVVEQSALRRRAFLTDSRCAGIPDEALRIERATKAMIRAAAGQQAEMRRSYRRYLRDLRGCEGLVVPRSRHDEVRWLYDAGELHAIFDPILTHLDGFVTALQDIQPEDPEVLRGVVSWRRLLTVLAALPAETARPCTAVRAWAGNAYSSETAPVDFEELRTALEALRRHNRAILRAAERLSALGFSRSALPGFTPDGLAIFAIAD